MTAGEIGHHKEINSEDDRIFSDEESKGLSSSIWRWLAQDSCTYNIIRLSQKEKKIVTDLSPLIPPLNNKFFTFIYLR